MAVIICKGREDITFSMPGLTKEQYEELRSQGVVFQANDDMMLAEIKAGDIRIEFAYEEGERD